MGEWFIPFVLKTIITFVIVSSNLTLSVYFISMGQKIHASGLRLKKRLNWNSSFCAHSIKNYSQIYLNNQQLDYSTNILLSKLNLFSNNQYITRNSKSSSIFSKLLQRHATFKNIKDYTNSVRWEAINNDINNGKKLRLLSDTHYNFADFFFNKTRKEFLKLTSNKSAMLTPKVFTTFITTQLNRNTALKGRAFTVGLNIGILKLINQILAHYQNTILGIKIICSGKWKKTRSGRKQKLVIKFGKIRNASISNVLLFDYAAQKTKFGVCGIKVWISHKKFL